MKKSVFCLALVLTVLLSLAPAGAFAAAEDGKLAAGDFIYMGEYDGKNIKWRVLDDKIMNNGQPGVFLFSEYLVKEYCTIFNNSLAVWQDSVAQQWCTDFYSQAFSAPEQEIIPAVSKTEETSHLYSLSWGATELIDERVFFISSLELAQYVAAEDGMEGLSGYTSEGKLGYYWLRTTHLTHPDYAGLVIQENDVHDFLVFLEWGARPALNLDMKKVLCLEPAYEGAAGEWKLAVTDGSRKLNVSGVTLDGDTLTAQYSGAATGQGEYISLLVRDEAGAAVHSERLCASAGSGTVEIPLSELSVPQGGTLNLISEKDNGDYKTSLASAPVELSCVLSFGPGEGGGAMDSVRLTPGVAYELPECGFTAPEHQRFDRWTLDGEPVEGSLTLSGDAELVAVYSNITVSSVVFEKDSLELELFGRATVSAAAEPEDAADRSLTWSCGGKAVSLTDNGDGSCSVKARFPGSAVINAVSNDGGAAGSLNVTVTGSALAAYAVNYGPYVLGGLLLALAAALLLRKKRRK